MKTTLFFTGLMVQLALLGPSIYAAVKTVSICNETDRPADGLEIVVHQSIRSFVIFPALVL